ncbi:MAG: sulfatase-like hydrolase/transferase [Opitutales bacterium]|nr:sulfatase-like hydrolase/transferase [Opitutales bacterium]
MKKTITPLTSAFLHFMYTCLCVAAEKPPNIIWLSCEDISPHLGCYGDPHAITPNLDTLSESGVRYTHAFATAGVCAPTRSGVITGMYQSTLGTQHMRGPIELPEAIIPWPALLRKAGYYCTNNVKEDYQFTTPDDVWDESSDQAHWRNRSDPDQPFFAVFNFTGCHESGIVQDKKYRRVTQNLKPHERQASEAFTNLPPYYPDTPTAREDWKRNYELITALDHWVAKMIAQLKEDGLYDNTIIMFWSDHGIGLPRAKRWLYDSGTHIPLIVVIPEHLRMSGQAIPGSISRQLVSTIDLGPTVLNLLGIPAPEYQQGQPFLGKTLPTPREYVFGARDRIDERYDIIRMVRNHRYKYLRNYEPLKPYYQYVNTAEKARTMSELRRQHEAGILNPIADVYFAPTKPSEELYDTEKDPHEVNNLADDPAYTEILNALRKAHVDWVKDTRDTGLIPEPLLAEAELILGSRYAILRNPKDMDLIDRLSEISRMASAGPDALPDLKQALKDPNPIIRYWAATGMGNLGEQAKVSLEQITEHLDDESRVVRIALARALCLMNEPENALSILTEALDKGAQWERLHAAIVLDEIDEMARPVIAEMKAALKPRKDLYADGKYVIRTTNRALNELEGTHHVVP